LALKYHTVHVFIQIHVIASFDHKNNDASTIDERGQYYSVGLAICDTYWP